jgi:hypothetical protein
MTDAKETVRDVVKGAALEAGAQATRAGLEKLSGMSKRDSKEARAKKRRRKAWLLVGIGVIGLLVLLALVTRVLRWLLLLGFLTALGYGGWLLLRPKWRALLEKRRQKAADRAALRAAEEERHAEVARRQAVEDDLAALKDKIERDR